MASFQLLLRSLLPRNTKIQMMKVIAIHEENLTWPGAYTCYGFILRLKLSPRLSAT